MFSKVLSFSVLCLAALTVLVATFSENSASARTLLATSTYTMHITCAQGIVDQKHQVTVTVTGASGDVTVTVDVPELSDTEAVTGLITTELGLKGVEGCTTGETSTPDIDEKQGHDFTLPDGYTVKSVSVTKNGQKDDGHLRALDTTGKKISNS